MKKINYPKFVIEDIYPLSLTYIDQTQQKRKEVFSSLLSIKDKIYSYGSEYEIKSSENKLFDLDKELFSKQGDELIKLYSNYFSSNKPIHSEIRKFYDLILTNGDEDKRKIIKCPYCLSSICSHVDHFLPESIYHGLSVNPKNLVPSCHNCNTKKKAKTFKKLNDEFIQFFHPYYDDLGDLVWLKANFSIEQNILVVSFSVDDNLSIAYQTLQKIQYTFEELSMGQYLSDKASETETTNLTSKFRDEDFWRNLDNIEIKAILQSDYKLFKKNHGNNHWLTALYKTISERDDLYNILKII